VGTDSPASVSASVSAVIPNYAGTTFNKTVQSLNADKFAASSTNIHLLSAGSFWRSSAAITSLLIFPAAGNFVQGTKAILYGTMGTGAQYGGGPMTTVQSQLSADVTMTSANTFYDGPSVNLTAGTWLLTGSVEVMAGVGVAASNTTAKLWDGTTVYASGMSACPSDTGQVDISLSAIVSPTSPTSYKISVASQTANYKIAKAAQVNAAGNNASYLQAVLLSTSGTSNILPSLATKSATSVAITTSDTMIVLTATGTTATLPAANSVPPGREFIIKNANGVTANTLAAAGSDHIDGSATLGMPSSNMSVTVVSDGINNWYVI
jgi:hypothetical protein